MQSKGVINNGNTKLLYLTMAPVKGIVQPQMSRIEIEKANKHITRGSTLMCLLIKKKGRIINDFEFFGKFCSLFFSINIKADEIFIEKFPQFRIRERILFHQFTHLRFYKDCIATDSVITGFDLTHSIRSLLRKQIFFPPGLKQGTLLLEVNL